MQLSEAISLIAPAFNHIATPQQWADLGCGTGLFSQAMASLLPDGSKVSCIDTARQDIVTPENSGVSLEFFQGDFTQYNFSSTACDGFLMANSLHYISDKTALLQKLKHHLSPGGKLVIIEYDTRSANPWVPYPITLTDLTPLCNKAGFEKVRKIGSRQSIYGSHEMYACEISRP